MLSKFSKEQLEKLALYTTGINSILLEVLLADERTDAPDGEREQEIEVEIFVVEKDRNPKSEPKK